jgi:3',5'-cyclic AMP phosphodiesterase CpdA
MRTLVHLSDIHFGHVDWATVKPLIAAVQHAKPDLVAISGDLTQRARTTEFRDARAFLDALPKPQIVVPGNHDIPLHNIYARLVGRFAKYKEFISEDLEPFFMDSEIAVAGINTARPTTWKSGRINAEQLHQAHDRLCGVSRGHLKVVVTHHPFELPEGMSSSALVGRAHMAMNRLAQCGADVFLAGHLHLGYTSHTARRYNVAGHSALVIQAGTATSSRSRGESNSFNIIKIEQSEITVERVRWNAASGTFRRASVEHFHRIEGIWAAHKDSQTHT